MITVRCLQYEWDFTRVSGGAGIARLSKAMLRISAAALGLGHGSRERSGTCAHLDSAVAGGPHVSVHAHPPVHVDGEAGGTLAAEGALRVDAAAVHADAWCLALVDV